MRDVEAWIAAGRLEVRAGGIERVDGDGSRLRIESAGAAPVIVDRVLLATGPDERPEASPFLAAGMAAGLLRRGPLGLGIDADPATLRVRDGSGASGRPIWALGPILRGILFETIAIPEIREEAATIAEGLLAALAPSRAPPGLPGRQAKRPEARRRPGGGFLRAPGRGPAPQAGSGMRRRTLGAPGARLAAHHAGTSHQPRPRGAPDPRAVAIATSPQPGPSGSIRALSWRPGKATRRAASPAPSSTRLEPTVASEPPAKFFVNQGLVTSRADIRHLLRPIHKQTVAYRFYRGRDLVAHGMGWVERIVADEPETSTYFTPIAITINVDSFEHLEFETRSDQLLVYTLV
jgi:hypothetical protein